MTMDVNKADAVRAIGKQPERRPGDEHRDAKSGEHEHDDDHDHGWDKNDAVALDGLPTEGMTPEIQRIINGLAKQIEPMRAELERAKALEARYRKLATTHPILDVPNRREFERELQHVIDHLDSLSPSAALVVINVADAEWLRDRLGRAACDGAMNHVIDMITQATHPTDTLGSLCGHDLGLVLLNGDSETVALRTESIRRRLVDNPFRWGERRITLRARFGATILHGGSTAAEAITAADRILLAEIAQAAAKDKDAKPASQPT